jgi:DsbC/DsbD-like thiol-disulfide interchange protein
MLRLFLLGLLAAGQGVAPKAHETAHLTVTTSSSAQAGKASLFVDVAPKPMMHVYSPGQKGYIAITLTLDANPAFTAAKAKYPAGEKLFMKVLNETQLVYSKPFRITQDIRFVKPVPGAPLTIKGTLRYQACDDKICYLPQNVPVAWTMEAVGR